MGRGGDVVRGGGVTGAGVAIDAMMGAGGFVTRLIGLVRHGVIRHGVRPGRMGRAGANADAGLYYGQGGEKGSEPFHSAR